MWLHRHTRSDAMRHIDRSQPDYVEIDLGVHHSDCRAWKDSTVDVDVNESCLFESQGYDDHHDEKRFSDIESSMLCPLPE